MAEKTKGIELIYSTQHTDYIEGRAYSNPRFYSTPRQGVTKVLLVGDWPQIEADYTAMGVPVERLDAAEATGAPAVTVTPADRAKVVPSVTADERAATHIPDDWRELPWTGKADAGLTLRSLSAILSDTPVLNKAQAIQAVEAELARRAAAQDSTGEGTSGSPPALTRTEVNADLEAMGVDVDPTMSDTDALALRDEARAIRDA